MPTDQMRSRLLGGAVACLLVFVAIVLCYSLSLDTLERVDAALERGVQGWTVRHDAAQHFFLTVQLLFGTALMTVYTLVAATLLATRQHVRAAVWTVSVMLTAGLSSYLLKLVFQRQRPTWPEPITTLSSYAFPSGHATGIAAAAGVSMVLAAMLVRRRSARRAVGTTVVAIALLVGLDRIFLGVHHPSDVVAGFALGGFWVCLAAAELHPAPRTKPVEAFSAPVPTSRRLAVVLNPSKFEDVATFESLVEAAAAESSWSAPTWHYTTIEDPGRSMAEAAAIDGAEMVLVAGGDGTVRTVCAELAGTGVSVGIVPAGTGNLLARNLGIPLFLQAAVDVALSGQDRAIDMVKVSGDGLGDDEHFMVMAGLGFDAAIMEGANEQIKAKVGWLAYVVSALRNLMFPAVRLEVRVDEGEWTRHRARTVVIGNVGYLQGGMPLLPDAAIDDGLIDVVMLHPRRFLSWIPLAVRVLSRARRTDELVNRMAGSIIEVRCSVDTPRQLDGDPIGAGRTLRAECVHGRLLVRVPL